MQFERTYALDGNGTEFQREEMFEFEEQFSVHEAEARQVTIDTCHLGRVRLCRVVSSGHTVSLREPDCVSILVPRRGRMVVETTNAQTYTAGSSDMLVFTPNMRVTHVLPDSKGRFESHCALIAVRDVVEHLSPETVALERRFANTTGNQGALGLRRFVDHLFNEGFLTSGSLDSSRARDAAGILMEETVRRLLEMELEAGPRRTLPSRKDHALVSIAEELMRERYREALSTREIARRLGVSARRIQVAFENVRAVSPMSALRGTRLEIARQRIMRAAENETITGIAMECGFFHLGRFSSAYSQAFGEAPSQTMRRSRSVRTRD